MERDWAAKQLKEFIGLIDGMGIDRHEDELDNQVRILEPVVKIIMDAVDPALRQYLSPDESDSWNVRWRPAKNAALAALGLVTAGAEARERMKSDGPELLAERLHPWTWEPARPMWEARSHQTAVLHAAQSINARLQQRLGRHDVSETQLCQAAFSSDLPKPGQPRLRFPGDRTTDTWKSLQAGALSFGVGCFMAIRNPVAHDPQHPIDVQQALEQLAALSVLARWIQSCEVEGDARAAATR